MWIYLAVTSAFFLGFYDISKKHALRHNPVIPVLFLANLAGLVTIALLVFTTDALLPGISFMPPADAVLSVRSHLHLQVLVKTFIVGISWLLAYLALKNLPISIATPIRASGPFWTIIIAVAFLGEMPTSQQWLALAVIITAYFLFSILGQKEGIIFHKNIWVLFIVLATLLGTASAVYDKYLLQKAGMHPVTLQFWFTFYSTLLFGIIHLSGWPRGRLKISWTWSIPAIGFLLIIADMFYFFSLHQENTMISLLSAIRRSSVAVSFAVGGIIFREKNKREKGVALAMLLAGVFLLITAEHR